MTPGASSLQQLHLEIVLKSPLRLRQPLYVGIRFADMAFRRRDHHDATFQFTVDEVMSPANPFSVSIVARLRESRDVQQRQHVDTVVPYDIPHGAMRQKRYLGTRRQPDPLDGRRRSGDTSGTRPEQPGEDIIDKDGGPPATR
jgi:hypothetical protein